jgi:hypothetical protein
LDQPMPRVADVESLNGWIRGHVESSRPSIHLCFFTENDRRAPRGVITSLMEKYLPSLSRTPALPPNAMHLPLPQCSSLSISALHLRPVPTTSTAICSTPSTSGRPLPSRA